MEEKVTKKMKMIQTKMRDYISIAFVMLKLREEVADFLLDN